MRVSSRSGVVVVALSLTALGCPRPVFPDGPAAGTPDTPILLSDVVVVSSHSADELHCPGGMAGLAGLPGDILVVTGSGWDTANVTVKIGGRPLAMAEPATATTLRVRLPADLMSGPPVVSGPQRVDGTLAKVVCVAPPVIQAITVEPDTRSGFQCKDAQGDVVPEALAGRAGDVVTVDGFGWDAALVTLRAGNTPLPLLYPATDGTLVAVLPERLSVSDVVVVSGMRLSEESPAQLCVMPPTITSVELAAAAGTVHCAQDGTFKTGFAGGTITVTGMGWDPSRTMLRVGAMQLPLAGTPTDTTITATLPPNLVPGPVVVFSGGAESLPSDDQLCVSTPVITAASTAPVHNGGLDQDGGTCLRTFAGDQVVVDGLGWDPATAVIMVGERPLVPQRDATRLQARVPEDLLGGDITVVSSGVRSNVAPEQLCVTGLGHLRDGRLAGTLAPQVAISALGAGVPLPPECLGETRPPVHRVGCNQAEARSQDVAVAFNFGPFANVRAETFLLALRGEDGTTEDVSVLPPLVTNDVRFLVEVAPVAVESATGPTVRVAAVETVVQLEDPDGGTQGPGVFGAHTRLIMGGQEQASLDDALQLALPVEQDAETAKLLHIPTTADLDGGHSTAVALFSALDGGLGSQPALAGLPGTPGAAGVLSQGWTPGMLTATGGPGVTALEIACTSTPAGPLVHTILVDAEGNNPKSPLVLTTGFPQRSCEDTTNPACDAPCANIPQCVKLKTWLAAEPSQTEEGLIAACSENPLCRPALGLLDTANPARRSVFLAGLACLRDTSGCAARIFAPPPDAGCAMDPACALRACALTPPEARDPGCTYFVRVIEGVAPILPDCPGDECQAAAQCGADVHCSANAWCNAVGAETCQASMDCVARSCDGQANHVVPVSPNVVGLLPTVLEQFDDTPLSSMCTMALPGGRMTRLSTGPLEAAAFLPSTVPGAPTQVMAVPKSSQPVRELLLFSGQAPATTVPTDRAYSLLQPLPGGPFVLAAASNGGVLDVLDNNGVVRKHMPILGHVQDARPLGVANASSLVVFPAFALIMDNAGGVVAHRDIHDLPAWAVMEDGHGAPERLVGMRLKLLPAGAFTQDAVEIAVDAMHNSFAPREVPHTTNHGGTFQPTDGYLVPVGSVRDWLLLARVAFGGDGQSSTAAAVRVPPPGMMAPPVLSVVDIPGLRNSAPVATNRTAGRALMLANSGTNANPSFEVALMDFTGAEPQRVARVDGSGAPSGDLLPWSYSATVLDSGGAFGLFFDEPHYSVEFGGITPGGFYYSSPLPPFAVVSMALAPDGAHLYAGVEGAILELGISESPAACTAVWHANAPAGEACVDWHIERTFAVPGTPAAMKLDPSGTRLVYVDADGTSILAIQ